MSKYLVLIYRDEQKEGLLTGDEVSPGYQAFMRDHSGSLLGGAGLEPTSTATSVRPDGSGGYSVTDGPFAETKEAVGGYFLIEAVDLDEALSIAKDIPFEAGVEVRPIRVAS